MSLKFISDMRSKDMMCGTSIKRNYLETQKLVLSAFYVPQSSFSFNIIVNHVAMASLCSICKKEYDIIFASTTIVRLYSKIMS